MLESDPVWPAKHVPETANREGMTSIEVAERLTEGGLFDRERMLARFRGFVRRNYIAPRALYIGDKKRAYKYGLPEVFMGACLGRLCDAGFNDASVLLAASNGLTNFNVEDFPDGPPFLRASPTTRASSPAAVVIDAYVTGVRGWNLDVACFHHREHGFRMRARIRNELLKGPRGESTATSFIEGAGFVLQSGHSVPLDPVLAGLFAVTPKPGEAVH